MSMDNHVRRGHPSMQRLLIFHCPHSDLLHSHLRFHCFLQYNWGAYYSFCFLHFADIHEACNISFPYITLQLTPQLSQPHWTGQSTLRTLHVCVDCLFRPTVHDPILALSNRFSADERRLTFAVVRLLAQLSSVDSKLTPIHLVWSLPGSYGLL